MDPINQTQNAQQPTPTAPVQPMPAANPVAQPEQPKGSNKLLLLFLIIILLVAVIGGLAYLMSSQNPNQLNIQVSPTPQAVAPTVTPTDEKQIQDVDTGDSDSSDLLEIQTDIQGL